MTNVVTYAKNQKRCFCQIRFDDGNRILISISGPPNAAVKVWKMTFFGMIPTQTIWEYSATMAGGFDNYIHGLHLMFPEVKHPLDDLRDRLLGISSITMVRDYLQGIQNKAAPPLIARNA